MDLRRFITFKTVVEEGSFLRASQKLCCTQSTVTFHIQQLEQELAIPLFEKIGRRMCLTAAGKMSCRTSTTLTKSNGVDFARRRARTMNPAANFASPLVKPCWRTNAAWCCSVLSNAPRRSACHCSHSIATASVMRCSLTKSTWGVFTGLATMMRSP